MNASRKISGSVFFYKTLFPALWYGFIVFVAVTGVLAGAVSDFPWFFVAPAFLAILGYVILKYLIWDLADEVYDEGTSLIFRKGGQEQRVLLEDIINIKYSFLTSPERVVVVTRSEGALGNVLVFSPPLRLNPLSKSPIVIDLIDRVDRARPG